MGKVTKVPEWANTTVMVDNILAYWDSASPVQREAGARWYKTADDIVSLISDATNTDRHKVALALAALSPRNPWRWNVFDAFSYAMARAEGRTMPKATTFKRNQEAAWRALGQDETVWLTSALKVRAFVNAILGDNTSVVVDTWAVRVATGGTRSRVANDTEYKVVAHAYVLAANIRHVPPTTMQAVTWLVAQSEGLATSRRGRHDLAFKAGTPTWLQAALQEGAIE